MPSVQQIVGIIIGFVVTAISTPIAMTYLAAVNATFNATNSTGSGSFTTAAAWAPVFTIFSVLLPVLYMLGVAIYFVPRGGK